MRFLVPLCFLFGSLTVLPSQAQDAARPRVLVRAWLASQAEQGRGIRRVELSERAEWTVDGPFGVRRIGWVANVVGGPDVDGWQREPISVHANGRRIPLERWQELEQQRRGMMGAQAEQAARAVLQLHRLVATMRPTGGAMPERIDGVPCWRVDLVPRTQREAIERYTLWFDREQGHLIRSRAVVRARRALQPFLIITAYTRIDGFDVPQQRTMEGTTQTKRRLRTYTLLFKYEASFSDYRFVRS